MSIRQKAFSQPAEFKPAVALSPDALDAVFLADPLRDREGSLDHLKPLSLLITVIKHGVIEAAKHLSEEHPIALPTEAKELALYALDKLWAPILEDLTTASVKKLYEHLLVKHFTEQSRPDLAGRFVRGEKGARPAQHRCYKQTRIASIKVQAFKHLP